MQFWFLFSTICFLCFWQQLDAALFFKDKLASHNNFSDHRHRQFVVDELKAFLHVEGYSSIDSKVFILWAETCKLPENSEYRCS